LTAPRDNSITIFIDLSRNGCFEPLEHFTLNSSLRHRLFIPKGKPERDPSRRI
jgi:hypothetical protein